MAPDDKGPSKSPTVTAFAGQKSRIGPTVQQLITRHNAEKAVHDPAARSNGFPSFPVPQETKGDAPGTIANDPANTFPDSWLSYNQYSPPQLLAAANDTNSANAQPTAEEERELNHVNGLVQSAQENHNARSTITDKQFAALTEAEQQAVLKEEEDENKPPPPQVTDNDDDEEQSKKNDLGFLAVESAAAKVAAAAAFAWSMHTHPRFLTKALKAYKKTAKQLKKAEAKAKAAGKDLERLQHEQRAAERAAKAARLAEKTAKANARTAEELREAEREAVKAKRAEQEAVEAAERVRKAEQETKDTAKRLAKVTEAAKQAERAKHAAELAYKNLSGVRRLLTVAGNVGRSSIVSFAVWRVVKAGAILYLNREHPDIAQKKALAELTASPFSKEATAALEKGDLVTFGKTLLNDGVTSIKDTILAAKDVYEHREQIADAGQKAWADMQKAISIYGKNPEGYQKAFGMMFADLGLTRKDLEDIASGALDKDPTAAEKFASRAGTAMLNDKKLTSTAADLAGDAMGSPQPKRPTTTVQTERPSSHPG